MGSRICSPCLRGHHDRCTSPLSCDCDHADTAKTTPPPTSCGRSRRRAAGRRTGFPTRS